MVPIAADRAALAGQRPAWPTTVFADEHRKGPRSALSRRPQAARYQEVLDSSGAHRRQFPRARERR